MKSALFILVISLFTVGCQQNTKPMPTSKTQLGPKASKYIQITSEHDALASSNLLRAGIKGINSSSSNKEIIYRFVWLDSNGFAIKGLPSRWHQTTLLRKTPFSLDMIATTPKANDYIIQLQERPNSYPTHSKGNE